MRSHPFCALIIAVGCCCLSARSQPPQGKAVGGAEPATVLYGGDTIMQRLDHAHLILNRIDIFMGDEFNTRKIQQELPAIGRTLEIIGNSLNLLDAIPEFKSLQLYGVMLDDIGAQLSAWRSSLFKYENELADIDVELISFSRDSSLLRLASDSLYLRFYLDELGELRQKWKQARQSTEGNLLRIKALQLQVAKQYFRTVDLKSRTAYMKTQLADQLFRKGYGYLWEGGARVDTADTVREQALRSIRSEGPLIGYFLSRSRNSYICILVIGLIFWWWLRRIPPAATGVRPLLYTLILILNLHPLFELHASTFPISQVPLLIILSILFLSSWPRRQFLYWIGIVLIYIFLLVIRMILLQRSAVISLVILNLVSITAGYYFLKQLTGRFPFNRLVQIAIWGNQLLAVLAIVAGISGRLSLARIFSTGGLFGVIDAIGLSVFIGCMMEGLRLEAKRSKSEAHDKKWADIYGRLEKGILSLFRLYALVIWLLSLAINLNVYDYFLALYRELLDLSFKVGSLSFQFGNILLFFLILYLANLLQKYIGVIFGFADEHALAENGRNGSRLAMFRLLVIVTGFLFAIAVSGLPLDKITIIFGALSVGIGLGLQGIVNNLVSGVILIFERPFQIGDFIELKDKKGLVRDIGIRSSKIATEEGTEIIMPNADLLSGQVINLTVRAHQVRVAIPITIEAGHSLKEIGSIVQTALEHQQGLSAEKKPYVLINSATERSTSITVLAWVSQIGRIQAIKSEMLSLLYQELKEKGVKVI